MKAGPFPLTTSSKVHERTGAVDLIELVIGRGEGHFTSTGATVVEAGTHTGRSAQDKVIVRDALSEKTVWWDNSKPLSPDHFEQLKRDFLEHSRGRELFVEDLWAGADPKRRLSTRVICEYAWHA